MKKKNTTIDDLAIMVQKGFAETATNHDLKEMRFEMNKRFDRVEKLILTDHKRRIERLETEVRELKDLFALK